jgi:release factor glutamine methyltransferase
VQLKIVQLKAALNSAINQLSEAKVPSPRMNAEILLMFALDCDRAYLYAHPERELTEDENHRYTEAVSQRASGIPAQYITGHQEFWGMDLIVSSAVLIPRPETEHLVETVLEIVGARTADGAVDSVKKIRIVDVGTGSGSIALALATELPWAEIHATDISFAALEIARANAARHQLESRVQFSENDLLAGFEINSFDIVVSNPPYVGESEEDQVQMEVRRFEPRNAVFAGPTGTEVIVELISQARTVVNPGGWLVMEISGTIAKRVEELLTDWEQIRVINDLQGIARVVAARKAF